MKRFVDIRGQGTGDCFAFWCTINDRFEEHSFEMAWDTWDEFEKDYEGNDLERYKSLCPEWVFDQNNKEAELFYIPTKQMKQP